MRIAWFTCTETRALGRTGLQVPRLPRSPTGRAGARAKLWSAKLDAGPAQADPERRPLPHHNSRYLPSAAHDRKRQGGLAALARTGGTGASCPNGSRLSYRPKV